MTIEEIKLNQCPLSRSIDLSGIKDFDIDELRLEWFGEDNIINEIDIELKKEIQLSEKIKLISSQIDKIIK